MPPSSAIRSPHSCFASLTVMHRVLEGVHGVDPHVVDQVVHDRTQVAAGVQQVRPPGRVRHRGHEPVAGQDELAQVVGADQRAGLEAHVVAAPDDLDPVELEHPLEGGSNMPISRSLIAATRSR